MWCALLAAQLDLQSKLQRWLHLSSAFAFLLVAC